MLPIHSRNFPSLRKNSFRRACRAVATSNSPVQYRGQPLTPQMIQNTGNCPPAAAPAQQSMPRQRRAGRAVKPVRLLSWNAGHLGEQQWAEVKTWLQDGAARDWDVIVLQETHWEETAEFSVSGWYCVSSASPPSGSPTQKAPRGSRKGRKRGPDQGPSTTAADGVMVLLSPQFDCTKVRWKEWQPGRVLEVRADWHGSRLSLAALYQHVWSSQKPQHDNTADRARVLSSLSKLAKQVPRRDTLIVAGDFNSSLSPTPCLVGPLATPPQDPRPDESALLHLLQRLRLVALNTWSCSPSHTFARDDTRTQIDYILVREPNAGRMAKQSRPLSDFPLGSWKQGGHLPVTASIPPTRPWQLPSRGPSKPKIDLEALQDAVREQTQPAKDMQAWVEARVGLCQQPREWDELLTRAAQQFFPKPRPSPLPDPLKALTRRMWKARRSLAPAADDTAFTPDAQEGEEAQPPQNPAAQPLRHPPPLGDTLLALQAQHKTAVKEARRKRVNTFLAEVDQTLRDGSQHVAYKTLKKLRPWQPARKAQLKDQQGNLLSPLDELQALKAYAEEIFACHPPLRFMDGALPPIPADLLAKHVGSIRPDKAVQRGPLPLRHGVSVARV